MKEDKILDMEFIFFEENIKLEKGFEIELSNKEGLILVNEFPFFKATINSVNDVFLAKIKKVLPLEEALEIKEQIKE